MKDRHHYDLLVVGGGVNGTGIARDAAGRGLKVLLVEANDLASATSSISTKIIHGGLRYLEQFEFRLVAEALKEREILLKNAPHIMWPLEFILPHTKELRPAWMIRLGLFLYDHLAKRKILSGSKSVSMDEGVYGAPLKDYIKKGFSYADGWVDDARLVALNAVSAKEKGATILTYTKCASIKQDIDGACWRAKIKESIGDATEHEITCDAVVNAAGPWVDGFLEHVDGIQKAKYHIRLVKGSHMIVPRLYDGEHCYILQNTDNRITFAIPYEQQYTLIGTTDVAYDGDPAAVQISAEEIDYLCDATNRYFKKQISNEDMIASYSGVRPLLDDGEGNASKVTRDYKLVMQDVALPFLTVYGGKITTYRKLAEAAVDLLVERAQKGEKGWTEKESLPGGSMKVSFKEFVAQKRAQYPWLPEVVLMRYAHSYGTRMDMIIENANSLEELGENFGEGVYVSEIDYLVHNEFARTLEDIIWRRSKLILHISQTTQDRIARYLGKTV
jgi:glycerol-3-phosphate dehydrogenase